MRTISNTIVANAKVVHMNRASLTLELSTGEQVYITRKVFNMLQNDLNLPTFITERDYKGQRLNWIAIPMTL